MDEINSESNNLKEYSSLSEEDIEKYAKNFSEYQELKVLESQFNSTANELNEAKNQLSNVEKEIKLLQEEKNLKEKRCNELLNSAKKFLENENYDEALEAYYEILEIFPKHIRALTGIQKIKKEKKEKENELREIEQKAKKKSEEALNFFESGKRFYRMTNYEKALDEFLSAVSINGRNPEVMEYIEKCEQKIREVEEAMNIAKKENENKRKTVNELLMNANSFIRKKEFIKGIECLEKALLISPDNVEIRESLKHADIAYNDYNNERMMKVKEEENTALEKKMTKIQMLITIANDFFSGGYFVKALSYYEEIITLDPSNIQAEAGIYKCNAEIKKEEEKKELLNFDKERKRKEEILHYLELGKHFYKMENYEKALNEFIRVISLDINNLEATDFKEKCEMKIKELNEIHVRLVQEKEKQLKTVNELLINANFHIRKKEFEKGIVLLEKALLMSPENIEIKELLKLADISFKEFCNENLEIRKKEEYESIQKINSKVQTLITIANDFYSKGFYAKALSYFEEVRTLDSLNLYAESGIYKCLAEIKKEEETKKAYEDEEERKKKIDDVCFTARVLFEEGNYEGAVKKWEYALSFDINNEEIRKNILNAKKEIKEINYYEDVKNNVLRIFKNEENKFNELKHKIDAGLLLFSQRRYSEALKLWESIHLNSLSEGEI